MTPDWYGSTVHLLFPNLGVATGAEYWLTLHMLPIAADHTRVEVRIRTMPLDTITKTKVFAKAVAKATRSTIKSQARLLTHRLHGTTAPEAPDNRLRSTQITDEDRRAAEAIQRAMQSPHFSVGPMARDHEAAISEFQRNIAAFVSGSL